MLENLIGSLEKGISVNSHMIHAHKITLGRFREEQNIELHYRIEKSEGYLLYAKVFHGRPPEYYPWVELFDIKEPLTFGATQISYFDSPFEDPILRIFSESLGPGARLFVEYYTDTETRKQLQMGFPVVLSRLGYKMFKLGFTWFKDWYFPEGYMEGNQKLQGEKPVNVEARKRHIRTTLDEIERFAQKHKQLDTGLDYTRRALTRGEAIISMQKC